MADGHRMQLESNLSGSPQENSRGSLAKETDE